MRKFFCLSAGLAVCAVGSLASAEKPELQVAENGIAVTPLKIAGIDRNFQLTTPWMEYEGGTSWPGNCGQDLAYDCFEPDETGYPSDNYPGCDMGSSRWYFGPTYACMYTANDMETENATTGEGLTTSYAWWWEVNGPGTEEDCYIVVFTAEDFDDTCTGPATSNGYDGVIIGYGPLGSGGYYYSTPVDLCDYGLFLTLPADGEGGTELILANGYDETYIYLATCAQFMLWGTDEMRAGMNYQIQWDDDNPVDGYLDVAECYDYMYGLCPDPLGSMFYVTGDVGPGSCLDLDVDGNFAGSPTTFTLSDLTPGAEGAVLYSLREGSFVMNRLGWNVDFGLKLPADPRPYVVFKDVDADNDGVIADVIPIPCAAGGKTIYFQGAERYTAEPCMSQVVAVTFEPC